jgi:microsomal epoxide hydrolase
MKVSALFAVVWLLVSVPLCAQGAMTSDIQRHVVTLSDGTRIHLLEGGEADARPAIIFIPGWTLPASLWEEQMLRFGRDCRVIAIDPRSQGDSSKTDSGNTPEQRARDLREILSIRRIEKAVLVGWSQGANDVAAYVSQFGTASIAAVAFVDSPVAAGPAEIDVNEAWSKGFLGRLSGYAEHPAEYSAGMVRSLFKKPHPDLDVASIVAHARKTPPNTGFVMLIMDIFGADRRPALAKLDRPTLVIASAESPLLEAQKRMAAAVPGAQLVVVPGTGHALFVDEPQIFYDALASLLARSK